jgi:hypothetical protein
MKGTYKSPLTMTAHGFGQAHTIFDKTDDGNPDPDPLFGEGVVHWQSRAPGLSFPQELLAVFKNCRHQACSIMRTRLCVRYEERCVRL